MTGMSGEIRLATEQDAATLANFRLQMLAEMGLAGEDEARRRLEAELLAYFRRASRDGDCLSWLGERDGQALGAGSVNFFRRIPYPKNPTGKEIYLLNMYTLPAFRKQGVARAILARVLDYARAEGYGRIWLHASAQGEALYLANGFCPRPGEMELFLKPPAPGF